MRYIQYETMDNAGRGEYEGCLTLIYGGTAEIAEVKGKGDNSWHCVKIIVDDGRIEEYIDGRIAALDGKYTIHEPYIFPHVHETNRLCPSS